MGPDRWQRSGAVTPPGTTFPVNPVPGQQFFNGTTLFIWDGNAWVPVSQTKTYIQATAPPAPNPGDTWFDGTQFWVWSGSSWDLVGPGATVGPVPTSTRAFAMQQPTGLTVTPSGTWAVIPYSAVPLIDTEGAWDPVTHKYTPKKAGTYYFNLRTNSGSGGGAAVLQNDPGTFTNALVSDVIVCIASTTGGWLQTSGMMQANGTSDFFRAWGWNAGGVIPAAGSNPVFNIFLLP